MTWLSAFVGNGTAIDWILGLVGVEAALLGAYRHFTDRGLQAGDIVSLLLPGVCLLLALRLALAHSGAAAIGTVLLAAFLAHIADVVRRWRSQSARRPAGYTDSAQPPVTR